MNDSPYDAIIQGLFSGYTARDMANSAAHLQQQQMLNSQFAQNWTGSWTLALGLPSQRSCAYCGTKQTTERRCDSCGAPNR